MIRVPFNCGDHKIDYMNLISYDEYRGVEGDKQAWLYGLNHDYRSNLREFHGGFIFPQVIIYIGNEVKITQRISSNVLVKEGQNKGVPKYVQDDFFFGQEMDNYFPWPSGAAPSPGAIIYIPEIDLTLNLSRFSFDNAEGHRMIIWEIDYGDNLDELMEKLRELNGGIMTISITSSVEVISSMIYSQINESSPKMIGFSMRKGTESSGREDETLCAFSADYTDGYGIGTTSVYSTDIGETYIYPGSPPSKDNLFFFMGSKYK